MARDFAGVSDLIDIGDIAIDGLAGLAISAWVNFDNLVDFDMVCSKRSNASNRVELGLGGSGQGDNDEVAINIGNGTNTHGVTSSSPIAAGAWQHWFVAYNGNGADNDAKLKLFINGTQHTLTYTGTIPTTLPTLTQVMQIGARSASSLFSDCKIAEFAIWTGIPGGLSDAQQAASILAKGYAPSHLRKNGLHYYPLIGRASPEVDRWGGNGGTLTGTAASAHPRIIYPHSPKVNAFTAAAAPAVTVPRIMFQYRQRRMA